MWVSTLRRPRWAMPSTASAAPARIASSRARSSMGTSMSVPSTEKRFCPRKARWRNCSKPLHLRQALEQAHLSPGGQGAGVRPRLHLVPQPVAPARGRPRARTRSRWGRRTIFRSSLQRLGHGALPGVAHDERRTGVCASSSMQVPKNAGLSWGCPGVAPQGVDPGELVAVVPERLDERRGPRDHREGPARCSAASAGCRPPTRMGGSTSCPEGAGGAGAAAAAARGRPSAPIRWPLSCRGGRVRPHRSPAAVGEELPPRLGDRFGVAGVLLEHRLGVGGVRTVEEGFVHRPAHREASPMREAEP